jgi:excinuclease UvrABC helicase subunit UvrB
MNKFDIEFYNGLMKGIVKCAGIVKKSADLKEANEQIDDLLKRIQKKIDVMVEESLE